ncbi:fungal-specific transcription factor domain-containing protein [Aspergillus heterothallicus]
MSSPLPTYRPARRRPAHLRTKTGCLPCRQKRKKCDERKGTCGSCERRWLKCIWPSQGATVGPGEIGSKHLQSSPLERDAGPSPRNCDRVDELCNALIVTKTEPPSLWSDWSIDSTAGGALAIPRREDRIVSHQGRVPGAMSFFDGYIPSDSSGLFDLLETKWIRQLIRPLAYESLIESYHHDSMTMAFQTPFFMHSLLACCAAEYPVDGQSARDHFLRLSQKHYVRAITGLREALGPNTRQVPGDAIVRAILALCIFERAKPWPSIGVGAHLSGLAEMIMSEAWGMTSSVSVPTDDLRRVMLEAFIFHVTTSVPFQPFPNPQTDLNSAIRFALDRLEEMLSHETYTGTCPNSPVLGLPPRLFVLFREISLLHREYETLLVANDTRLALWRRATVSMQQLAEYRKPCLTKSSTSGHSMTAMQLVTHKPGVSNPLFLGPTLYMLTAEILLMDILKDAPSHLSPSRAKSKTISGLVEKGVHLVSELDPSHDYYAEYYGWPIYVLAKFARRKEDRSCLLSQVVAFWKETRSGTMLRLADILRGVETGLMTVY